MKFRALAAFAVLLATVQLAEAAPTTFDGLTMKARFYDGGVGNNLGGPLFFTAGPGVELTNFASLFDVDFSGNTATITFTNAATFSIVYELSFDWTPADGKMISPPEQLVGGIYNPAYISVAQGNSYGFLAHFNGGGIWNQGDQLIIDVPLDDAIPGDPIDVPEPTSAILLLSGLMGAVFCKPLRRH